MKQEEPSLRDLAERMRRAEQTRRYLDRWRKLWRIVHILMIVFASLVLAAALLQVIELHG